MRRLIEISSNHQDNFLADREWLAAAYGSCLCEECRSIDRRRYPEPIDVALSEYPPSCLTGLVWWTGIKVFDRAFLDQLAENLSGFVLGRCLDERGEVIDKYATCYTSHYIIERGNAQSRYTTCEACGLISPNGWFGAQYTLSEYLDERLVYQNASCTMFIDEELVLQLDFSPWPDADLTTIAVKDKPVDKKALAWVSPDRSFRKDGRSRT